MSERAASAPTSSSAPSSSPRPDADPVRLVVVLERSRCLRGGPGEVDARGERTSAVPASRAGRDRRVSDGASRARRSTASTWSPSRESCALIGPSGCGKSTLFEILAGLEQPTGGEVLVDGRVRVDRLGNCAFMPQRDGLLPWRRTIDNVTIGLELAGVGRAQARPGRAAARALRARRLRRRLALAAVGGHAPARRVPAHGAARQAGDAARRAVRIARRHHSLVRAAVAARGLAGGPARRSP